MIKLQFFLDTTAYVKVSSHCLCICFGTSSAVKMFPFTIESVPIHYWKCSHSLLEVFLFTIGSVPIHCWKCSHLLLNVIGRQLKTVEASCKKSRVSILHWSSHCNWLGNRSHLPLLENLCFLNHIAEFHQIQAGVILTCHIPSHTQGTTWPKEASSHVHPFQPPS